MSGRGNWRRFLPNDGGVVIVPPSFRHRPAIATAIVPPSLPPSLRHTEARKSLYLGQAAMIDRLDRKARF